MLSRGGADAVVLREFDLGARAIRSRRFRLPEAKGGAAWLDRDTLLLSSALGDGHGDDLGLCAHGTAVAARQPTR